MSHLLTLEHDPETGRVTMPTDPQRAVNELASDTRRLHEALWRLVTFVDETPALLDGLEQHMGYTGVREQLLRAVSAAGYIERHVYDLSAWIRLQQAASV